MELLHVIFAHFETIRNVLLAIPERKLMPIAAFTPIIIGGTWFAWIYIKWKFFSSDEKTA